MKQVVVLAAALFFGVMLGSVSALDICGLESLDTCDPYNKSCLITTMEPQIRKWFSCGQPEYFQKPVDPLHYEELVIPIRDGHYALYDVTIEGVKDSELTDWIFDQGENGKGFMGYTYNLNIVVKAKFVYAVHENCAPKQTNGPLTVKLHDVSTYTRLPLSFFTRCSGEEFMAMEDEEIFVDDCAECKVTFECGQPPSRDRHSFKRGIIDAVGARVTRILTDRYRTFCTQIGVQGYFDLKPECPGPTKKSAKARVKAYCKKFDGH